MFPQQRCDSAYFGEGESSGNQDYDRDENYLFPLFHDAFFFQFVSAFSIRLGNILNKTFATGFEKRYVLPSIVEVCLPPSTSVFPVLKAKAQQPSYSGLLLVVFMLLLLVDSVHLLNW